MRVWAAVDERPAFMILSAARSTKTVIPRQDGVLLTLYLAACELILLCSLCVLPESVVPVSFSFQVLGVFQLLPARGFSDMTCLCRYSGRINILGLLCSLPFLLGGKLIKSSHLLLHDAGRDAAHLLLHSSHLQGTLPHNLCSKFLADDTLVVQYLLRRHLILQVEENVSLK